MLVWLEISVMTSTIAVISPILLSIWVTISETRALDPAMLFMLLSTFLASRAPARESSLAFWERLAALSMLVVISWTAELMSLIAFRIPSTLRDALSEFSLTLPVFRAISWMPSEASRMLAAACSARLVSSCIRILTSRTFSSRFATIPLTAS